MSQHHRSALCIDHDPSRVFARWGLRRCELLDRNVFDAALNSLAEDADPPSDHQQMAEHLLRDGLAVTRLLNDAVVIASESETAHRHNPNWPGGISGQLEILLLEFRGHSEREEIAYRAAAEGHVSASTPARLSGDHMKMRQVLTALRSLTAGYRAPADSCTAWRLLYGICLKIEAMLLRRMDLEEGELMPSVF